MNLNANYTVIQSITYSIKLQYKNSFYEYRAKNFSY